MLTRAAYLRSHSIMRLRSKMMDNPSLRSRQKQIEPSDIATVAFPALKEAVLDEPEHERGFSEKLD